MLSSRGAATGLRYYRAVDGRSIGRARRLTASGPPWSDDAGLVTLPSGHRVRGRPLARPACAADFALVLAAGPVPAWSYRRVRWPDFWVPLDRADALDALVEAHRRAHEGERVEVACRGGVGRTGTALAALAVLDGLDPGAAVAWVRDRHHPRAVETPWQRRWLRHVARRAGRPPG
jgi:Protein-tyrosine phosphatase